MVQAICTATCKGGRPCRAPALRDGQCFVHSPITAEARDRTRSANGRARMRRRAVLPDAADITIAGPQDVLAALGATLSRVQRGELDCRVGNCLFYGLSIALRAVEGIDMARLRDELRSEMAREMEALRRAQAEAHRGGLLEVLGDDGV